MTPTGTLTPTDTLSPRRRPGRMGWLLMAPLLVWLAAFVVAPTAILLAYSFYQPGGVGQAEFQWRDDETGKIVAFDNYVRVFDPAYLKVFWLSLGQAAVGCALAVGVLFLFRSAARRNHRLDDPAPRLLLAAGLLVGLWLVELAATWWAGGLGPYFAEPPTTGIDWRQLWASLLPGLWGGAVAAALCLALARERLAAAAVVAGVLGFLFAFDDNLDVVTTGNYLQILWKSVKYAAYTTIWCIALGYPVAYFIGRASEANRNRLLMLVMIPFWTSFLIRTFAWITILKSEGTLNGLLDMAGVSRLLARLAQFEFLGRWLSYRESPYVTADGHLELLYTPAAITIGLVYSYLPFMILPIYGSVEKLDNALVEAAFDLGAGPVRAFQHVIIPLTQPGIVAGCLLVFIPAIGMFAVQDLLGGRSVQMIGNVIQNQFGSARNAPFGAALGMTLVGLFVLVFWLTSRRERE